MTIDERILVVEDDLTLSQLITTYLKLGKYNCVLKRNGEEAWQWLTEHTPALVISDWMMPNMDGLELCRRVRREFRLCRTYFMLLTAREKPQDAAEALDAGVDDFVRKPVHQVELLARVRAGLRQKHLEEHRMRAEKLQSVATLTTGLAHDFNNLISSALSNLSVVERDNENEQDALSDIDIALRRMADLTRQLLAFSGQGKYLDRPVDLNQIVRRALLHHPRLPPRAGPDLSLRPELPSVRGDPTQVEQVVFNLLQNAVEAVQDGGRLRLATNLQSELSDAWTQAPEGPPPWAVLEVQDTGVGMEPETLSRVFEPFFTTKFPGRGLGMAAVHGIVKGHGGEVYIDSRSGEGTRVELVLPIARTENSASP